MPTVAEEVAAGTVLEELAAAEIAASFGKG